MVIVSALCMFLSGKRTEIVNKMMARIGLVERKMGYFEQLASNFSAGKEIRLFGMDKIIMNKIHIKICQKRRKKRTLYSYAFLLTQMPVLRIPFRNSNFL